MSYLRIPCSGTCGDDGCLCAGLDSGDYCENDQGKAKNAASSVVMLNTIHVLFTLIGCILLACGEI